MEKDLMIPRYKVIADWPGSLSIEVGQIITGNVGEVGAEMFRLDAFPHLFRKLNWYEERDIEYMPKYVKLSFDGKTHFVHKVERWTRENSDGQPLYEYFNKVNYLTIGCVSELLPATEEEYNDYINSKP